MGQKTNPIGIRLGLTRNWKTIGYRPRLIWEKEIIEDIEVRKYIEGVLKKKEILNGDIEIIRETNRIVINVLVANMNIEKIIKEKEIMVNEIRKITKLPYYKNLKVNLIVTDFYNKERTNRGINLNDIKLENWNGTFLANYISKGIEEKKRIRDLFGKLDKFVEENIYCGYKVIVSGRISSAPRSKRYIKMSGKVPIGSIKKDIDYGIAVAKIGTGTIGIKIWCYNKE